MSTRSTGRPTRVALVDAFAAGHQLVPTLGRHGAECVHVRSTHPDVRMAKLKLADGFLDDIRHDGDLAATAAALREWGVDRVVPGGETGVELAEELSVELGTPGNGVSRPSCRRDKYEMVLALRDAGVTHAATMVSADAEEVVEWAETTAGYPVVLKPVASAGRDHVSSCASADEIRATHAKIMAAVDRQGRPNKVVLAQEFLDGTECFVNSVSRGGKHHVVEVWRYSKSRLPDGLILHEYAEPLASDDPDLATLESYTHEVLDALEIRNSASHAEVMLTAAGPVLVECAGRGGGGVDPAVFGRSLAADQMELLALSVADPEEFDRLPANLHRLLRHTRFVNLVNTVDGAIAPTEEAMAAVRALPSFAHLVLMHPAGQPLARTVDFASQPGYVVLVSDDPAEIDADYRKLREMEQQLYGRNPE